MDEGDMIFLGGAALLALWWMSGSNANAQGTSQGQNYGQGYGQSSGYGQAQQNYGQQYYQGYNPGYYHALPPNTPPVTIVTTSPTEPGQPIATGNPPSYYLPGRRRPPVRPYTAQYRPLPNPYVPGVYEQQTQTYTDQSGNTTTYSVTGTPPAPQTVSVPVYQSTYVPAVQTAPTTSPVTTTVPNEPGSYSGSGSGYDTGGDNSGGAGYGDDGGYGGSASGGIVTHLQTENV